jgi:hypothetical protein
VLLLRLPAGLVQRYHLVYGFFDVANTALPEPLQDPLFLFPYDCDLKHDLIVFMMCPKLIF